MVVLIKPNIITNSELQRKIANYRNKGRFIGTDNLTKLKAIDAVKDGASQSLSEICFGVSGLPNPQDLKAHIKGLFEQKVKSKEMRKITYTRIKDRGADVILMDGVNYDFYIPDCGPSYSSGNKTPVVKTAGNQEPIALYSLGNNLDTGPSSSNAINLKVCDKTKCSYSIDADIMTTLGYPNCSIDKINDNSVTFELNIDGNAVTKDGFFKLAIGNTQKNKILQGTNTTDKKKIICIKSLGDTLIVYYWLWACKTITSKNIALLTCDSVVAFQADILCEGNGHFLLNYTETGEKKISVVYYKGAPPNFETLFNNEKREILNRYDVEIAKFRNTDIKFSFSGLENNEYNNNGFIQSIEDGLNKIRSDIDRMRFTGEQSYIDLKKNVLIPIVKSFKYGKLILIRTKNKFCMSDTTFLGLSANRKCKSLYEVFLDSQSQMGGISKKGGRNDSDLYDDWILGIKKVVYDKEPFYYQPYTSSLMTRSYKNIRNPISSDTLAINLLRRDINKIYKEEIIKINFDNYDNYLYLDYFRSLTAIEDQTNETEDGSLFDLLTYIFHYEPDYTTDTIRRLIKEFIENYERDTTTIQQFKSKEHFLRTPSIEPEQDRVTSLFYKKQRTGGKKTKQINSKQNKNTRRRTHKRHY